MFFYDGQELYKVGDIAQVQGKGKGRKDLVYFAPMQWFADRINESIQDERCPEKKYSM